MIRLGIAGLVFSLLVAASPRLHASPYTLAATYHDSLGLSVTTPVTLPDLSQGGTVVLGSLPIVGPSNASATPQITNINGTFDLRIGFPNLSGFGSNPIYALIEMNGTIKGSVQGPSASGPTYTGGYTGTGGGISFPSGSLTETPDLDDLWRHSERIHLSGLVIPAASGGSLLETVLTIDPPGFYIPSPPTGSETPVPEPAGIAVFAMIVGGLAIRSRLKRLASASRSRPPSQSAIATLF